MDGLMNGRGGERDEGKNQMKGKGGEGARQQEVRGRKERRGGEGCTTQGQSKVRKRTASTSGRSQPASLPACQPTSPQSAPRPLSAAGGLPRQLTPALRRRRRPPCSRTRRVRARWPSPATTAPCWAGAPRRSSASWEGHMGNDRVRIRALSSGVADSTASNAARREKSRRIMLVAFEAEATRRSDCKSASCASLGRDERRGEEGARSIRRIASCRWASVACIALTRLESEAKDEAMVFSSTCSSRAGGALAAPLPPLPPSPPPLLTSSVDPPPLASATISGAAIAAVAASLSLSATLYGSCSM
eukprot:6172316-Pleurochrysis_carterae.AAC.5